MITKKLRYDEIKFQRNFILLKNNEILTQQKYGLLQYL